MGEGIKRIGALVRHYAAVVLFPTIAVSSIVADLRHTRKWKNSKEQAATNSQA